VESRSVFAEVWESVQRCPVCDQCRWSTWGSGATAS